MQTLKRPTLAEGTSAEHASLQHHLMEQISTRPSLREQTLAELVSGERGGPLGGWQLPHGHVVLAGQGAVSLGSVESKYPMPQVLQYAPAPASSPSDWLDIDGPDGPYQLVGWAYLAPYEKGSAPPSLRCIAASEWFVHEAGWHLMDGGMLLTPDATAEPPRPQLKAGIMFWHPQFWDIHVWSGEDGAPAISLDNPKDPGGGLKLSEGSFFYLIDGRKQPPPKQNER